MKTATTTTTRATGTEISAPSLRLPTLHEVATEAKLLLIAIPVLLWTLLPIYHLFLFAISPKEDAFAGKIWPDHPTLRNFRVVFTQDHHFLSHFWMQLFNSVVIAVAIGALTLVIAAAVGVLTLFIATAAAFSISRLRVPGGRIVMNLALFTYFIPAAFLAVPMYKTMGRYGLLNNKWSLILTLVTFALAGWAWWRRRRWRPRRARPAACRTPVSAPRSRRARRSSPSPGSATSGC